MIQKLHSKTVYRLVSLVIVAIMIVAKDVLPEQSVAGAVALFTYTLKAPNDVDAKELARALESVELNKNA